MAREFKLFLSVSVSGSLATEEEFEKRNQSKAVYLGGLGKLIILVLPKQSNEFSGTVKLTLNYMTCVVV